MGHQYRWVGGAAHPDKEEVTPDQALGILNLAEQMANIIYVMPAISKETIKGYEGGKLQILKYNLEMLQEESHRT